MKLFQFVKIKIPCANYYEIIFSPQVIVREHAFSIIVNPKTSKRDQKITRIQCFRVNNLLETQHHGFFNKKERCFSFFFLEK